MKTSKFLALNWADIFKGFLVALIAFLLDFIEKTILPQLNVPLEVKLFIAYLIKNFLTPQKEVKSTESIGLPKPVKPKF